MTHAEDCRGFNQLLMAPQKLSHWLAGALTPQDSKPLDFLGRLYRRPGHSPSIDRAQIPEKKIQ
jgi:hypothetical protein